MTTSENHKATGGKADLQEMKIRAMHNIINSVDVSDAERAELTMAFDMTVEALIDAESESRDERDQRLGDIVARLRGRAQCPNSFDHDSVHITQSEIAELSSSGERESKASEDPEQIYSVFQDASSGEREEKKSG